MSDFGILSLLPPLVAIGLAILTKRVLFALFTGVWVGALMIVGGNPISATVQTWDWIIGNALDDWNQKILLYDFIIGAAFGLVYKSGAASAFARAITRRVKSSRAASILGWVLGVAIFFDDYGNTVIVGNSMRPITDKTRVSREMLAYIDDSTAAPVATIALVSSWIGYEVGLIQDSFDSLGIEVGSYAAWLSAWPYKLYSILAIVMVLLIAYTHRHYGAMLKAEYRARTTGKVLRDGAQPMMATESDLGLPMEGGTIHAFIWPILALIGVFLYGMWYTGGGSEVYAAEGLKGVMSNADTALALLWAGFAMLVLVMLIILVKKQMSLEGVEKGIVQGMKQMVMANAILLLAWSIKSACDAVGTADFVVNAAVGGGVPGAIVPLIIFLSAAFVSFTTGTSWGTFGVIMPMAIPLGYTLGGGVGPILYASMGAVLAGGIFGDHCSPISDTTIMSSMFSGSDHIDHVSTQLPYAVTVAGVSAFLYLLFAAGLRNGFVLLGLGIILLIVIHRVLSAWYGKKLGIPNGEVPVYVSEEA